MNPDAKAITAFFASAAGEKLCDPDGLGLPDTQYLRNRLQRAFAAGMEAGKRIAVATLVRKVRIAAGLLAEEPTP